MDDIFLALFLISIVALVTGLINPAWVVRWGENRTRKEAALYYGGAVIIFLALFGITAEPSEDQKKAQTKVDIPAYSVLSKTKPPQYPNKDSGYVGDVLIEEDIIDTPPEKFIQIARKIAEKENFNYGVSFYTTKDSFKVNVGRIISESDREVFGQENYGEETVFMTQEKMDKLLNQGYIGNFEDGEFKLGPSSDYYKQHRGDSNQEEDWIVR